jgi:hypothetical protein
LAEAKSRTNHLSDCPISEQDREICYILDICSEGLSSLESSLTQIELIQATIGSVSSSETRSKRNKLLQKIEAGVTIISAAGSMLGGIVSNNLPIPDTRNSEPSASQEYKMYPELFSLLTGEDLLNESYAKVKEEELQKRDEELEKSASCDNFPKKSGSPNPDA